MDMFLQSLRKAVIFIAEVTRVQKISYKQRGRNKKYIHMIYYKRKKGLFKQDCSSGSENNDSLNRIKILKCNKK